jgi:hypothetical protein
MSIELAPPYDSALREAAAFIRKHYTPIGIIVSGSIIRGTGHGASDLDVVVIHEPAWRQRTQRFFNGVPAEMFVNPAFQIRRQMARDTTVGRPVMAHMLATGVVLEDATGILGVLREEASANLAAGPNIPAESLLQRRYMIATGFEDAIDIAGFDPDRARSIVTESLTDAVKLHFLQQGQWLPRSKALLSDLDALDPALGAGVRAALREPGIEARLALATPIIEQITGASGFFEWESEPQHLEPG